MKLKLCIYASVLLMLAVQPVFAACVSVLPAYLKSPQRVEPPNSELYHAEFALVKIVSVRPDKKPRGSLGETGWLGLIRIESNGKSLPIAFSVLYQKRGGMVLVDCETWDDSVPKPGKRLLGFFRHENDGWTVPELASPDVVLDADQMGPAFRKEIQPLFHTRL